ncbi:hypothetical protein AMK14_23675 [Streptomyces sp. TSRI0445]|nr:hypothetical protein DIJ69_33740 [Streptomyces globisporus]OKI67239.1 hypothetical protein AMK14_23675 [Streptomyces sp. TSRI0445]PPA44145.1 hypothetical protein BF14_033620 [Streptomyces griseus]RAN21366.1 hypothetical protein A3838_32905 [Streptomyces badius]RAN29305.1 hypothetical protein A3800_32930 [Streptomyces badius]
MHRAREHQVPIAHRLQGVGGVRVLGSGITFTVNRMMLRAMPGAAVTGSPAPGPAARTTGRPLLHRGWGWVVQGVDG